MGVQGLLQPCQHGLALRARHRAGAGPGSLGKQRGGHHEQRQGGVGNIEVTRQGGAGVQNFTGRTVQAEA